MSRTYRKLKNKKGNEKTHYSHGWNHINKMVVKRKTLTTYEAEDSYFMTVIKGDKRVKYEIKDSFMREGKLSSYSKRFLRDGKSGVNNLPKVLRKLKEKQYRSICKQKMHRAIEKDLLEDYQEEDIRIVDADWCWW